jgi:ribose transport system substrate-binding protein
MTAADPGRKVPTPTTMAEGDKHDEEDASHDRRRRCRRPRCRRSGAAQQKKTLAVVVKGLDNPFFTVLGDGCALWNKENPKSEYTCLYTGPASSADEAGEVQIVEDLINKGVAGHRDLALQRAGHGQHAQGQGAEDADHDDRRRPGRRRPRAAQDLPRHQQLRHGRADGQAPEGAQGQGRHRVPAARQRRGRQHQCARGGLSRHHRRQEGRRQAERRRRLDRDRGCPLFTNDQIDLANQQMADVFTKNPKLDAFILVGGWAQFGPQAYAQVHRPGDGQAEVQGPDHHRRRHAAASARRAEGPGAATRRSASARSRWAIARRRC